MGALAKKQIVNLYNRQKMRTFIVILATIALCTALPSTEDEIVPEMSLIQAKEEYDAHADAVASLEFLQTTEGRSKNACESLAKDTIKEIDNSIKTQQNMLNKLYKGELATPRARPLTTRPSAARPTLTASFPPPTSASATLPTTRLTSAATPSPVSVRGPVVLSTTTVPT